MPRATVIRAVWLLSGGIALVACSNNGSNKGTPADLAVAPPGSVGDLATTAPASDLGPPADLTTSPDLTTVPLANGQPCGDGSQCASDFCVDGVCCDNACDGQCQSCSASGSAGTCTNIIGQPGASRTACTGTGTCGGRCDGTSKDCVYPPTTTICGTSCDGLCDGAGACSGSGGVCPNGYACSSSTCLTSCSGDGDCQTNFQCVGGACQRVPESNCLDGVDNNGDGLADCQDPTCTAVECVPAPQAGTRLGVHITTGGTCPTDYDGPFNYHSGLIQGAACSGCSCATRFLVPVDVYGGPSCGDLEHTFNVNAPPFGSSQVENFTSGTYGSFKFEAAVIAGCNGSGAPTAGTPSWTTNDTFCSTNLTSKTCSDSAHLCVAKPPTGPVCNLLPGASTCPAAYPNGASVTYYQSFDFGTCNACSCTAGTNRPADYVGNIYTGSDGSGISGGLIFTTSTNTDTCQNSANYSTVDYASVSIDIAAASPDNCSASSSTKTPATGTGGALFCCQ